MVNGKGPGQWMRMNKVNKNARGHEDTNTREGEQNISCGDEAERV